MNPFVFTNSNASTILFINFIAWCVLEGGLMFKDRKSTGGLQDKGSKEKLILFVILGLLFSYISVIIFPTATFFREDGWILVITGTVLNFLGIGIRFWAILTLGKYFTRNVMLHESHKIIIEGPYKFVRHPGYLGSLISIFGIIILYGNIIGMIGGIILSLTGYLIRINVEEELLMRSLKGYKEYAGKVKKLIPYMW